MSERLKYEGRLSVLEKDAKKLRIALGGLVAAMRENLDPLEKVEKLNGELIVQQAVEFGGKQSVLREKLTEIEKAKEILGRE